jgi:hypothetical protein
VSTRFYFPSTGAAAVTPANDSWNRTAGASSALTMVRIPIASSMTTITNTNDGTSGHYILLRQFVSDPIPYAQTISGIAFGVIRCIESASTGNHNLAFSIRACSQDGGTIRTPALMAITSAVVASAPYEMGTGTATSSLFYDSSEGFYHTLTDCTIQATDRLVIEIGFRNGTTTTTRTGGVVCGDDSANDLGFYSINTSTDNPWIEFQSDLFAIKNLEYYS